MRFGYAFSELGTSIRRNFTLTVAVTVTVWISLTLLGAGLLVSAEIDLAKSHWQDRAHVTVYMCNRNDAVNAVQRCRSGIVTAGQRMDIERVLRQSRYVSAVQYASQQDNLERLRTMRGDAASSWVRATDMQASFQAALKRPARYGVVRSQVAGLQGVQSVQDSRQVLDPLFRGLDALQWTALGLAGGLLVAAVLQIGNTVRLTVFSRRREIGIMRLVGASNLFIRLPFIVEAVTATLAGALLACATLAFTPLLTSRLQNDVGSIPWIGREQTLLVMPVIVAAGVLLAVTASVLTLRRYLKV